MSAFKGTPGPWDGGRMTGRTVCIYAGEQRGGAKLRVADVGSTFNTLDDVERVYADAKAISAVPDMAAYIQKQAEAGDTEAAELWERINGNS